MKTRMNFHIITVFLSLCSISSQYPLISKKTYKGLKGVVPNDVVASAGLKRLVYYFDQTVAVVDINGKNEIHNCDIIEVYEPYESKEILGNLSSVARPTQVSFSEMNGLMLRCQTLDSMKNALVKPTDQPKGALDHANAFGTNAFNLLSGILPGTKWCGAGDIAEYYNDLGPYSAIDRCCRTHDLCPVKVRAQSSRYNLTNHSFYSKSHCDCDSTFYNCLKSVGTPTSKIMGKIYFNILQIGCIEDLPNTIGRHPMSLHVSRRFSEAKLHF